MCIARENACVPFLSCCKLYHVRAGIRPASPVPGEGQNHACCLLLLEFLCLLLWRSMSKNKNTKYIQKDNNTDNRSEILSTAFMSLFLHGLHVLHALRISNIFRMGLDSIDL
jgi:hypothetical protein